MTAPAASPPESVTTLRARTKTGVNWPAAFLLYAKGATIDEIAGQMDLNPAKLRHRMREEDWENLVKRNASLTLRAPAADVSPQSALQVINAVERIKQNREEALSISQTLRTHIKATLDAFAEGKQHLSPDDIYKLARAAAVLDVNTMQALGDDPSPRLLPNDDDPKKERGKKDEPPPRETHFHISLPAVASAPRVEKSVAGSDVTVPVAGKDVDPVMTPTPKTGVLAVETVADDTRETPNGRASVDFAKLGKVVRALPPPAPTKSVPDFVT